MKSRLPKDWQPSERILELAKSKGMPIKDWLLHLLPEWRLYWLDRNIKRDSWDSTFWNHAKREWEKVDKSRLYRETERLPSTRTFGELMKHKESIVATVSLKETQRLSIERFNEQCEEYNKRVAVKGGIR